MPINQSSRSTRDGRFNRFFACARRCVLVARGSFTRPSTVCPSQFAVARQLRFITSFLTLKTSSSFFCWNRPSITMFTLHDVWNASTSTTTCFSSLAQIAGSRHRTSRVTPGKGTWMRSTCLGCSQWLVESDKRWAPLRSVPIGR